jgi:hypothetical protein
MAGRVLTRQDDTHETVAGSGAAASVVDSVERYDGKIDDGRRCSGVDRQDRTGNPP